MNYLKRKRKYRTSSRAATVCRHCDMRETNVDVVGESTSSRLSSTNSETLINPGMADVCYFYWRQRKNNKKSPTEMAKEGEGGGEKHTTRQTTTKSTPKWPRKLLILPSGWSNLPTKNSVMLLLLYWKLLHIYILLCMAFLFLTFSMRVSFCFSYPLVTMIPTSCESAEKSKLTMFFDTVMAELFLLFLFFFF